MAEFSADVAAARAGVSRAVVDRLTELGILEATGTYTDADVRRIHITRALERSGLSIDALGTLIRGGALSLEFIDQAGFNVFAAIADETFADVAGRTGVDDERLVTSFATDCRSMSAQEGRPDPASIAALLEATERAHGEYEARELGGAYDEAWARWYAAYAVEHGIGELLETQIGVDELETELTDGFAAFQAADPQPPSGWAEFIAERLARRKGEGETA